MYADWVRQYPIVSIEDGVAESDWDGWKALTRALGDRVQLVGDDVFVTNPEILQEGNRGGRWERAAREAEPDRHRIGNARRHRDGARGAATRRSSRTDLARPRTARSPIWRSARRRGQIKTGSASRSDRVAKYNQLLRIEEELGLGRAIRRARRHPATAHVGRTADVHVSARPASPRRKHLERENRFTGWTDVDLSDKGRAEAHEAGRLMAAEKFEFDVAYTSVLKRAIRTLWIALDEMDMMWVPGRTDRGV